MSSAFSVIIHDSRLSGYVPNDAASAVIRCNETSRVRDVLLAVRGAAIANGASARRDGLRGRLTIMCHGMRTRDGHFFLGIGDVGLQLANVMSANVLDGYFRKIKVKACGTQEPAARAEMVELYTKLARAANTQVIAAEDEQLYNETVRPGHLSELIPGMGNIDFGDWEGVVWRYDPDGTRTAIHGSAA